MGGAVADVAEFGEGSPPWAGVAGGRGSTSPPRLVPRLLPGEPGRGPGSPPSWSGRRAPPWPNPRPPGRRGWSGLPPGAWLRLFPKVAHPQGSPRTNQNHDQQQGIHKGQRSGSSYGHGACSIEPHSQYQYRNQGGLYARGQAPSFAFRRDFPAMLAALPSSFALGGLRVIPSSVTPGTCS